MLKFFIAFVTKMAQKIYYKQMFGFALLNFLTLFMLADW